MGEKLYIIRDWNIVFEKFTTRDRRLGLDWVSLPTAQDGEAFSHLARTQDGVFAIGVFQLLVQWTGRQPRAERGILRDHKGPLTPRRIHVRFGVPEDAVAKAWATLESPDIGWLVPVTDIQQIPVVLGCASDGGRMDVGCAPDATRMTQTDRQDIVVIGEADLRRKALREAGISPGKTLEELAATDLRPSRIAVIAADVKRGGGKPGAVVVALRAEAANPSPPKPDTPLRPRESAPEPPVDPEAEKQRLRAKLETASGAARRMFEDQLRKLEGAA